VAPPGRWDDEGLLLVAHGAARHADADRPVQAHAAALRSGGSFAEVGVGLLNGAPSPAEALAALRSRVVHVVPFFMEEGWFVREALPRALAEQQGHVLRFYPPVGLHPALADRIAVRARAACAGNSAGSSLLLIGHGSARAPGRRMALHRHAETIRATATFAAVGVAFLEEPPLLADALRGWRDRPVVALGFFANDGSHVRDDVPAALAAARAGRDAASVLLIDAGSIGEDAAMPGIILDTVAKAG
jgi:sirohydrochlorin cobaltochelatase